MGINTLDYINAISAKVQQLIKRQESLKKENTALKESYEKLLRQQEELKQRVEDLRQQELLLKAAAAPLNPDEKKEMIQKINAYLRTIDKCISLLGK
ncbi:MAG: hypothetical protein JST57_12790 [Bacteroidetes bacterium]|jgi:predicted nuclease with TOPRIM domain|nr:hypothetical protein [Bacteroidota bacterium]MBS1926875.1 hypothetical protein [Bacteroidota bacterium]MCC6692104.1 hypothetical protein [Chitinophagaceae bacterium]HMU24609.1 hypothetical protein [Ferruginibacter sp.]HRD44552.1 hypothetical protein [Ferruginibacter sp.]